MGMVDALVAHLQLQRLLEVAVRWEAFPRLSYNALSHSCLPRRHLSTLRQSARRWVVHLEINVHGLHSWAMLDARAMDSQSGRRSHAAQQLRHHIVAAAPCRSQAHPTTIIVR